MAPDSLLPGATSVPSAVPQKRHRTHGVTWTLFDYTPQDEEALQAYAKDQCDYMVYGKEVCPSTGRPHLQGYHHYKNPRDYPVKAFRKLVNLEQRGRDFPSKGDAKENQAYCIKTDHFWEYGEPPSQGQRADWSRALECLKTSDVIDVIQDQPHLMPCVSALQKTKSLLTKSTHRHVKVFVLVGITGTGKTRAAWDAYPDLYSKPEGAWWDGYQGQQVVLLDDFNGGVPITTFLKWIDRYPVQLPVKGAFVPAVYDTVIITSNCPPDTWFPGCSTNHLNAMNRRFHRVHLWKNEFSVEHITDANHEEIDVSQEARGEGSRESTPIP